MRRKARRVQGAMMPADNGGSAIMQKHDIDVYRLALQMADTGQFSDWHGLQQALLDKGIREADYLLDNDKIRSALDLRCTRSSVPAVRH
jgi:hypothetical protein